MPILNTRDVRATRFESSLSNDAELNILKGPFVIFRVLSALVVVLRAYSLHKCIPVTNPPRREFGIPSPDKYDASITSGVHISY